MSFLTRSPLRLTSVLVLAALSCDAEDSDHGPIPTDDELAGESDLDGEPGKADGVDNFTFFRVEQDLRKCVFPLCGGVWVSRVNRSVTRCADGSWAERCYVADVDLSSTGMSSAQIEAVGAGLRGGGMILRGDITTGEWPGFGALGRFAASEVWRAGTDSDADGTFTRVTNSGLVCITTPCWGTLNEDKLNSVLSAQFSELDLSWSGADDETIATAFDQVFGGDGLIVAGYRYWWWQGGWQAGRVATQFWSRVTPEPEPTSDCVHAGCSSQLCVAPEQADGACGFTETPELLACLDEAG